MLSDAGLAGGQHVAEAAGVVGAVGLRAAAAAKGGSRARRRAAAAEATTARRCCANSNCCPLLSLASLPARKHRPGPVGRPAGRPYGTPWESETVCWKVGRFWNGRRPIRCPEATVERLRSKHCGWGSLSQSPNRRAPAGVTLSACAQRRAQRLAALACASRGRSRRGCRPADPGAEQVAQVLRDVAPPAVEEVGRVGVAAGVVADRDHSCERVEGALAERRLELGADQQRPPGVHQADRRRRTRRRRRR